ncbi:MAG: hypothetical protein LBI99_06655, partial [Propionibacteriaceae bacterium]|nr:hypothetical protein [Propionibacteriaceae bacterium]
MNIKNVIAFEVRRTLRRPTFWLSALLIPVLIGVALVVVVLASVTSALAADSQAGDQEVSFEYADASGLIDPEVAAKAKGTLILDPAQGLADVKAGRVMAFINYPKDPASQLIAVAGVDA